jgi:pimeloyl-ACP methyl ester carboxylesterase/class 3 adenylate cyclase
MDPVIQYAKASDGVVIACSSFGSGPPLIVMPILPLSHLQVEWQMTGMRHFLEHLAETHTIIRYDARGLGLSDRNAPDRSLDAHLLDIEAVSDKLGVTGATLFAASYSGPIGIRLAARRPDLVSRLILWCTHAFHGDVVGKLPQVSNQQREAVNKLADVDRDLFIRTYLHRAVGWTEGEIANQFVEIAKQSIDMDNFFENLSHHMMFDARPDLAHVNAPTLVLHRPAFIGSHVDVAKGLASEIRGARLALLDGESVVPFIGPTDKVLEAIEEFVAPSLSDNSNPGSTASDGPPLRFLLYADIESHTQMMQRLGDARGREVLRAYEQTTRAAIAAHRGMEARSEGDGFLAAFESVAEALGCAMELQRAFANPVMHGECIKVRIGLNAGEPIVEGKQLFGEAVFVVERIAGQGHGGQIIATAVVKELAAGRSVAFRPAGEYAPGTPQATSLFEVEWHSTNDRDLPNDHHEARHTAV